MTHPDPLMSLTDLAAHELAAAIASRQVSCREVMAAFLARIADLNPGHNAIVSLREEDDCLRDAEDCDRRTRPRPRRDALLPVRPAAGDQGRVADGRPAQHLGLADPPRQRPRHRCADGAAHEVGRLHRHRQDQHAGVRPRLAHLQRGLRDDAQRLRSGAFGGRQQRRRGGRAGAAHAPVADGSDSMGSLRNPAAWNNVFGFRPSQGRVPAYPAQEAWITTFGTEGPLARNVRDLALLLDVQAGWDRRAPLSLAREAPFAEGLGEFATAGIRIGWLGDLDGHLAMEPGILDVCRAGLARLEVLGCAVEALPLGFAPERIWAAWLVWRAWLVKARLAHFLRDPANRSLMKPEALWEHDRGVHLTASDVMAASCERTLFHEHLLGPVRAFRRAGAADGAGLAVPGRMALAEGDRRPGDGHLPPLDGGGRDRHPRRPALHQRPGRLRRARAADGPAADRRAARRSRDPAPGVSLRRCGGRRARRAPGRARLYVTTLGSLRPVRTRMPAIASAQATSGASTSCAGMSCRAASASKRS
jgi:amidase